MILWFKDQCDILGPVQTHLTRNVVVRKRDERSGNMSLKEEGDRADTGAFSK